MGIYGVICCCLHLFVCPTYLKQSCFVWTLTILGTILPPSQTGHIGSLRSPEIKIKSEWPCDVTVTSHVTLLTA